MYEYFPLLVVGAVLGVVSTIFIIAYLGIRKQKEAIGFDRNMKDSEITKRLLAYAKPYWKNFAFVLFLMLFSISYEIIAPILMGEIVDIIDEGFEMSQLLTLVFIYAGILIVSLISTYVQAIVLQKTGQKIISTLRMDLFDHIQKNIVSHRAAANIAVAYK